MKVLVCGGRDYSDSGMVDAVLGIYTITTLITGMAPGADTLAYEYAVRRDIPIVACPADWELYGRAAGPMRNERMIKFKPDLVIAFPGGKGTEHMVGIAKRDGIPVTRVT